jgi:putative transposase
VKLSGEELEMKKSRYTDEQIAFALKQAETGTPVTEVIRRMGISEQTFYRWKKVYGGLGTGELRRLKQLEDENRQLKQLVADLSLDKHILQDVLSKSSDAWTTTLARRVRPGVSCRERTAQLLGAGRRAVVGALHLAQRRTRHRW